MNSIRKKKILITGGAGFVGSNLVDCLIKKYRINPEDIIIPRSKDHDLRLFENARKVVTGADIIFHLAADVGGSGYSRRHPATQFYNNLIIALQILEAAKTEKVEKIILAGSTCAYPEDASQPLRESELYGGLPNPSLDGYGMAKRGIIFAADVYKREFGLNIVTVLPNNTYGPGDNFDLNNGHVIPSLIRKCLEEKELIVWGDGSPTRDFLYVKDYVAGLILAAEKLNSPDPVNLGSGKSVSIRTLVKLIVKLTDFKGSIIFDTSKPPGLIQRSASLSKAKKMLGFSPKWSLEEGLKETIEWYKKHPAI